MRKKLVMFGLLVGLLALTQVMSTVLACHKELVWIEDADGDGRVEVGEYVEFRMAILIRAYRGYDWTDIMVYDRISAELDVDLGSFEASQGTVVHCAHLGRHGRGATLLIWDVGDLEASDIPGEGASLYFTAFTNINPAGKQRYTSPGTYELNSGPTLKCIEDGHQYSEYLNSISITVHPAD